MISSGLWALLERCAALGGDVLLGIWFSFGAEWVWLVPPLHFLHGVSGVEARICTQKAGAPDLEAQGNFSCAIGGGWLGGKHADSEKEVWDKLGVVLLCLGETIPSHAHADGERGAVRVMYGLGC